MGSHLTHRQWAETVEDIPISIPNTIEELRELAVEGAKRKIASLRKKVEEHRAIISRYKITFRQQFGVCTAIFNPDDEQMKVFDILIYDSLRLCGETAPCFILNLPPGWYQEFNDGGSPDRHNVSFSRYQIQGAASTFKYDEYRAEHRGISRLNPNRYQQTEERKNRKETLLPGFESQMYAHIGLNGYRCTSIETTFRRNISIRSWRVTEGPTPQFTDEEVLDQMCSIFKKDPGYSRTIETIDEGHLLAKLTGSRAPNLKGLPGCMIRKLQKDGEIGQVRYFCQPVLRVREAGVPRPLGFGELGSMTVEYLAAGGSKMWYITMPRDNGKVKQFMLKHFGDRAAEGTSYSEKIFTTCEQKTRHLEIFVDPSLLESEGIELYRVLQQPGECVVTLPYANFQETALRKAISLTSLYLPFDRVHQFARYRNCNSECGITKAEGGWVTDDVRDIRSVEVDFSGYSELSQVLKKIITEIRKQEKKIKEEDVS